MVPTVAARIAPDIDRLRLGVSKAVTPHVVALAGRYGLTEHGGYLLAMLRNTIPDRVVERSAVAAIFLYGQRDRFEAGEAEISRAGLIEHLDGDRLRVSDAGRAALEEYHATAAGIIDAAWHEQEELVASLFELTSRCLDAAGSRSSGSTGSTYSVMRLGSALLGASKAAQLAEHLTALRFDRFDAHVAAWQALGLSVENVMALATDDPARLEIEDETNRRAEVMYQPLGEAEGEALVAGLSELPTP